MYVCRTTITQNIKNNLHLYSLLNPCSKLKTPNFKPGVIIYFYLLTSSFYFFFLLLSSNFFFLLFTFYFFFLLLSSNFFFFFLLFTFYFLLFHVHHFFYKLYCSWYIGQVQSSKVWCIVHGCIGTAYSADGSIQIIEPFFLNAVGNL